MTNDYKNFVSSNKENTVRAVQKSCIRSPQEDVPMPLTAYKDSKVEHPAHKYMIGWERR